MRITVTADLLHMFVNSYTWNIPVKCTFSPKNSSFAVSFSSMRSNLRRGRASSFPVVSEGISKSFVHGNFSKLQKWKDNNIQVYRQIANWVCYLWAGPVILWGSLEGKQACTSRADLFVMKKWKMETAIPSKQAHNCLFLFCLVFTYSRPSQPAIRMTLLLNRFLPEVPPWVYFFSNRLS